MESRIKINKIKCKSCGDIIESTYTHDFKKCSCGDVSVDGGTSYLKRSSMFGTKGYEELSE